MGHTKTCFLTKRKPKTERRIGRVAATYIQRVAVPRNGTLDGPTAPKCGFDQWVADMEAATTERTELEREHTQRKIFSRTIIDDQLSHRARAVFKREHIAEQARKHRTAKEYRALLLQLPIGLRQRVASIVWWDLFSGVKAKFRHTEFDDMLGYKQQDWSVTDKQLAHGLVRCGYSPWKATQRAFSATSAEE